MCSTSLQTVSWHRDCSDDIDLEKAFPLTHEHLTRTRVMTHALVYEWKGSDESLKPLLLTAHQGE